MDSREESPLQLAAGFESYDQLEMVKLLLTKGADRVFSFATIKGRNGTPLHGALCSSTYETAAYLLEECPGLGLKTRDQEGRLPLHMAAMKRYDTEVFSQLSNHGELLKEVDHQGRNALHFASAHGAQDIVDFILKNRPEMIHTKDDDGWTALHWACKGSTKSMVLYLIWEYGAKPQTKTHRGWRPQDVAIWHSNAWIFEDSHESLLKLPQCTQVISDEIETTEHVTAYGQPLKWKDPRGYRNLCESCQCVSRTQILDSAFSSNTTKDIHGARHRCKTCEDVNFCFKCARHVQKIHYVGHEFEEITI
jgi:hypothetical protein